MLAGVFHESDLLDRRVPPSGLLDELEPAPSWPGSLSVFVYEHRSPEPPPAPWFPDRAAASAGASIAALERGAGRRRGGERAWRAHRPPDPGFVGRRATHGPPATASHDVVGDEELSGGDFVRTMKQLIDLLRQVGDVAPQWPPATWPRRCRSRALPRHRRRRHAVGATRIADE